jgi:ribosomal protein S18 acetylase RimI-like enzyme
VDTPYSVRLATHNDAKAIAQLSKTEIEYGFAWRWTSERIERSIADSVTNVAVACSADRLLAFGIMEYHEVHAHLVLFAVQPTKRRRGIGSALLQWLEEVALASGITTVELEARATNIGGIAFYVKRGYQQVARVRSMYSNEEDGVCLRKRIARTIDSDATP